MDVRGRDVNKWFGAAAALSTVLTAAHIFGGTPEFLTPILETELPDDIRAVAAIVWHGVSLLLVANSAVLIGATMNTHWGRAGVGVVAAQYVGFVALFLYFGIIFLGDITALPQWVAFALISAMIWMGTRRKAVPGLSGVV